jgi:hypothetical protein
MYVTVREKITNSERRTTTTETERETHANKNIKRETETRIDIIQEDKKRNHKT